MDVTIWHMLYIEMGLYIFSIPLFLSPLAGLLHPEDSKKYLVKYCLLRFVILFIGNFISYDILFIDLFLTFFGGVFVNILKEFRKRNKKTKDKANQIKMTQTIMPTTGVVISNTSIIENEDLSAISENLNMKEDLLTDIPDLSEIYEDYTEENSEDSSSNNFNGIYTSVDDFLEKYVLNSIKGVENTLHPQNIKQIRLARIILAIITFLNISYICLYHKNFGISFILEIVAIVIYKYAISKMNLLNFIKKEIKARPEDNMDYIIASSKQNLISKSYLLSKFILPATILLCCFIYAKPHIIYEKKDDGYAIRLYTLAIFNESEVILPDEYKGKKVLELRGGAFANMGFLEDVTLPKYITEIRGNTFENSGIKKIVIPEGVTRIGGHAFYGCGKLKEVKFPCSLREIGSSAFRKCNNLFVVEIPTQTIVNERAFKESPTIINRFGVYKIDE